MYRVIATLVLLLTVVASASADSVTILWGKENVIPVVTYALDGTEREESPTIADADCTLNADGVESAPTLTWTATADTTNVTLSASDSEFTHGVLSCEDTDGTQTYLAFHIRLNAALTAPDDTVASAAASSVTLGASASTTADLYNGYLVSILKGPGRPSTNCIYDYSASTKVASVTTAWIAQPDNTSEYILTPDNCAIDNDKIRPGAIGDDEWGVTVADSNVIQIDGATTDGNNATLNLKQLNVVNSAGDAIIAQSTGSNGDGIDARGNGSGSGYNLVGGATGHGLLGTGGATSGDGIRGAAAAGDGDGVSGYGEGAGDGLFAQGGATGRGGSFNGGATSGEGLVAASTSGDGALFSAGGGGGDAFQLDGEGAGHAVRATGGATGNAFTLIGGATSGNALDLAVTSGNEIDTGGVNGVDVGAIGNNVITNAAIATSAIDDDAIAPDAIGASELAADAGEKIFTQVSGTADSGSTTTIVDAARTESVTDYWENSVVLMTSGANVGQLRAITEFNFTTDTITVSPAFKSAVSTDDYIILRSQFADSASVLTESGIADAIWEELLAGHTTPDSAGKVLSDGGAGTSWGDLCSSLTTQGSVGNVTCGGARRD